MVEKRCVLLPEQPLSAVEAIWHRLDRAGQHSFFLTWTWIGAWLRNIPPGRRPGLACLIQGDEVLGAVLVGSHSRRRLLLPERKAFVNAAGHPDFDCVTLEHNGFAGEPGWALLLA